MPYATDAYLEEFVRLGAALKARLAHAAKVDPDGTSPLHLQMGMILALAQHSALVELLIREGAFYRSAYEAEVVTHLRKEIEGLAALYPEPKE